MSYWELRQWIETSIPWWVPFVAPFGLVFIVIFFCVVEDWVKRKWFYATNKWARNKK